MKLTRFIGGEALAADTPHDSINPSDTDDIVASYPAGGTAEVDAAVSAARAAFPAWAAASPEDRGDLLDRHGATRSGRIEIGYAACGPNWTLSVRDDGVGPPIRE